MRIILMALLLAGSTVYAGAQWSPGELLAHREYQERLAVQNRRSECRYVHTLKGSGCLEDMARLRLEMREVRKLEDLLRAIDMVDPNGSQAWKLREEIFRRSTEFGQDLTRWQRANRPKISAR